MKIFTACLIFVALLAYATAQSYQGPSTGIQEAAPTFVQTMSAMIVEWLSRAFAWAMEAMEIKVRSVRFLSSLYTDDNLTLLKKFLNVGLRFGGWLYETIPNNTDEGSSRFLGFLFPERSFKESGNNYEKDQTYEDEDNEDMNFENGLKRNIVQQAYPPPPQVSNLNNLINGGIVDHNNLNNNLIY
ncbi:unnamed protein product [Callosobruchus maculatus]|uniref:Uncharacterized protein n=1 Tax=Callosobruchus maculatus TaxID=64391 RepID=A0A653DQ55_CALMS|nr:unnamed protein product [Callosobruchus maculatus]